jgi:hypothetical protein
MLNRPQDPYCVLTLVGHGEPQQARSEVAPRTNSPRWESPAFIFTLLSITGPPLELSVWNESTNTLRQTSTAIYSTDHIYIHTHIYIYAAQAKCTIYYNYFQHRLPVTSFLDVPNHTSPSSSAMCSIPLKQLDGSGCPESEKDAWSALPPAHLARLLRPLTAAPRRYDLLNGKLVAGQIRLLSALQGAEERVNAGTPIPLLFCIPIPLLF